MNIPTCKDLVDEDCEPNDGYKPVYTDNDPSWRHGLRVTQVFYREIDNTYWSAHYRLSTDGETNELREGLADIRQVEPYTVEVVKYRAIAKLEESA